MTLRIMLDTRNAVSRRVIVLVAGHAGLAACLPSVLICWMACSGRSWPRFGKTVYAVAISNGVA
jgi:hypothetical protein